MLHPVIPQPYGELYVMRADGRGARIAHALACSPKPLPSLPQYADRSPRCAMTSF